MSGSQLWPSIASRLANLLVWFWVLEKSTFLLSSHASCEPVCSFKWPRTPALKCWTILHFCLPYMRSVNLLVLSSGLAHQLNYKLWPFGAIWSSSNNSCHLPLFHLSSTHFISSRCAETLSHRKNRSYEWMTPIKGRVWWISVFKILAK